MWTTFSLTFTTIETRTLSFEWKLVLRLLDLEPRLHFLLHGDICGIIEYISCEVHAIPWIVKSK